MTMVLLMTEDDQDANIVGTLCSESASGIVAMVIWTSDGRLQSPAV